MNIRHLATCAIPVVLATISLASDADRSSTQDPAAKSSAPAAQDRAADEKKVRELLELTGAARIAKQTLEQTLNTLEGMAGLQAGFAKRFMEIAKVEDLVELQVPILLKHVDAKDLDAILAFMRSDVGKRWNAAQPAISQDGMTAGQEWGRKLGGQVARELAEKK